MSHGRFVSSALRTRVKHAGELELSNAKKSTSDLTVPWYVTMYLKRMQQLSRSRAAFHLGLERQSSI
jgi:hypothetical protein